MIDLKMPRYLATQSLAPGLLLYNQNAFIASFDFAIDHQNQNITLEHRAPGTDNRQFCCLLCSICHFHIMFTVPMQLIMHHLSPSNNINGAKCRVCGVVTATFHAGAYVPSHLSRNFDHKLKSKCTIFSLFLIEE